MSKVVECVPNFSEGRDQKVIDAIASSIGDTAGVTLLDVDPGASTNRTVMTLVGSPEDVLEAALNGARTAYQLIDMSKHTGEHPRMGALDVCPFIPVRDVTTEECVQLSKRFGELLAAELDVPVFLYGAASSREYRKALPQVRCGEYEGLTDRLTLSDWTPDYGPARFVPRWGATATGVRNFLIAYNVNLLGTKEQAHRIALNIREQGRGSDQPGRLRCCRAIGWYLDEADLAQISINLTDFNVTPMHVAFEECRKDAAELKLGLTGSEIVGLVPLTAILQAADFYIHKENLFVLEEKQKVRLAIERLGLSSINVFHPEKRIIEYCLPDTSKGPLASLSVSQFVRQVAARTPAPGGGSVAALCGALGAALASMVGRMSYGKRQWEHLDLEMRDLIPVFHHAVLDLVPMVDADTDAFNQYMMAVRLPRDSTEEADRRAEAMEQGLKTAINTPLSLLRRAEPLWSAMERLAAVANIGAKSDLQVAARCLETASWGAYNNVSINLKDLQDDQFRTRVLQEADSLVQHAQDGCRIVLAVLEARCK